MSIFNLNGRLRRGEEQKVVEEFLREQGTSLPDQIYRDLWAAFEDDLDGHWSSAERKYEKVLHSVESKVVEKRLRYIRRRKISGT